MKCIFFFIVFTFNCTSLFSQDIERKGEKHTETYDSLWYFQPFNADLAVGVWIPIGLLSTYYFPSYQFTGSLGIGTAKSRFQLCISARDYDSKKDLPVVTDINNDVKTSGLGASLGGFISIRIYANRFICAEASGGITWESIPVVVKIPFHENDSLDINAIGFSIGFTSWINSWKRLNFGIRGMYTFSTFNNSSYINSPIGNHLASFSLTYRFPRRSIDLEKKFQ